MSVTDLLDSSDNKRTFETAKNIEITKNTVKFGSSVYQFRNVTGFRVGEIPKALLDLRGLMYNELQI